MLLSYINVRFPGPDAVLVGRGKIAKRKGLPTHELP